MPGAASLVRLQDLRRRFRGSGPSGRVAALDGVSLDVMPGEISGVIGRSGAGKSTLVRCVNLLERPDSGRVLVCGQEMMARSWRRRCWRWPPTATPRTSVQPRGLALRITEFGDFIQSNAALASGDLDANAYQHQPFLDQQVRDRGYKLAPVGRTVMTAMAVFGKKAKTAADLPGGARIAIPNDPTNGGRALVLLAGAGVFELREGADFRSTVLDITDNPKRVRVVELEAAQIARALDDVGAGAITGNYAVAAGMDPLRESLAVETADPALIRLYCCPGVARQGDADKLWTKALAGGYADPALKEWVAATFKGAVIPGA